MFDLFGGQSEEEGVRNRPVTIPVPFMRGPTSVGSGDVLKRLTDAFHIPQCGGCGRRQAAMNRTVEFRPMRSLWED